MPRAQRRWRIKIDPAWCKACGICIEFCPKRVLEADEHGKAEARRPEDCTGCRLCELRCPDFAVEVSAEEDGDGQ